MDSTICEDEEQRSSETKLTLIDKFEINLNSKRFKTFDNLKKKLIQRQNNQIIRLDYTDLKTVELIRIN